MAQSKFELDQGGTFALFMTPSLTNPMMTIFADMTGRFLEGLVTAQKDWANFVQHRVREDAALARQLANSQSLADMHQIYSQYLQTAFQQYREQTEKVVQRGDALAQHIAKTGETSAKKVVRAHR
jgi:hypothetical protein